jgi:hypothetical protein
MKERVRDSFLFDADSLHLLDVRREGRERRKERLERQSTIPIIPLRSREILI